MHERLWYHTWARQMLVLSSTPLPSVSLEKESERETLSLETPLYEIVGRGRSEAYSAGESEKNWSRVARLLHSALFVYTVGWNF